MLLMAQLKVLANISSNAKSTDIQYSKTHNDQHRTTPMGNQSDNKV